MSPDPVFDLYVLQTSHKMIEAIRFFYHYLFKRSYIDHIL